MTIPTTPRTPRRALTAAEREQRALEAAAMDVRADAILSSPDLPEQVIGLLDGTASDNLLTRYSLRNLLLLVDQATALGLTLCDVATAAQWTERGRVVLDAQVPMRIVRPTKRGKKKKTRTTTSSAPAGARRRRAKYVLFSVYEYAQTQPIPDVEQQIAVTPPPVEAASLLWDNLIGRITHAGYTWGHPAATGDPAGTIDHTTRTVTLHPHPGTPGPAAVATLAVQLASIMVRPRDQTDTDADGDDSEVDEESVPDEAQVPAFAS